MVSAPTVGRENTGGVEDEEEEDEQPAAGPTGTARAAMVMGNVILAQTRSTSLYTVRDKTIQMFVEVGLFLE